MVNNLNCIKIKNVEQEFNNIATKGKLLSVVSKNGFSSAAHAQGSNYYIDKHGKRHFIVTYDKQDGSSYGHLLIFNEASGSQTPIGVATPKGFNHPGSFQLVGDYLFLPTENYKASDNPHPDGASLVCVYDMTPVAEGKPPKLFEKSMNFFKNHKAGMLGATDEWVAIHDNATFYLYKIDQFADDGTLKLTAYGSKKLKNFQAIGLVKEEDGDTYLLGLCSDGDNLTFKDSIWLYRLNMDHSKKTFDAKHIKDYHVTTDQGNSVGGVLSIHFRYGGGVFVGDAGYLMCLGTGRNIKSNEKFNYNEFTSVDRMEIIARQKPLDGQKGRASSNFSMKGFRKGKVRFTVYKNGKIDKNISFNVKKDVRAWSDKTIYSGVRCGQVAGRSNESPLYISSPSPSDPGDIKIVIEGVD